MMGFTNTFGFGLLFIPFLVWTLFWKGLALWHAVKHEQRGWFLLLLILNTAGIVEIIYLFVVLHLTWDKAILPITKKAHGDTHRAE